MSSNSTSSSSPAQQATSSTHGTSSSTTPSSSSSSTTTSSSANGSPSSSPDTTSSTPITTTSSPSAPPATSPTTAPVTPQSTPAQTTQPTGQTTPASLGSQTSPTSTSTTPQVITSTSLFTSQVATTLSTTDASGSIILITTTVPTVVSTAVISGPIHSSSSHTAVIVGSVVGGVAGIAILALLLFCVCRRRNDEFDGNFDPDHVIEHHDVQGTLPRVDLAEEVTPFPQSYTNQGSASMRQFGESTYFAVPSSPGTSGQASGESYPSGAGASIDGQRRPMKQSSVGHGPQGAYIPPINPYGPSSTDWYNARQGAPSAPSSVSQYSSSNPASNLGSKEREALGRGGPGLGLGLATQPEVGEGSGEVVQHQDGGRAPVAEEHVPPPREIPPAYESIPQD